MCWRGVSAVCCLGYSARCVVVFGTARERRAVLAPVKESGLFFCLRPKCVVSSVPWLGLVCMKLLCGPLWLCYGRLIPRATTRDSRPHHQCIVTPQALQMCCTGKEVVVDACQSISLWWICEVSVCLEYFCHSNSNWNEHHHKSNSLPCQVVEIGVMMDLE